MEVIHNLEFQWNQTAVCIGKFDGIHRGHRLLLQEAKKEGLTTVMFTFSAGEGSVLYAPHEKRKLAEKLGIDRLVEVPLDDTFCKQTPEEFARDILQKRCGAAKVVVGSDFRFGKNRAGDAAMLTELGHQYGFQVVVLDKLEWDGGIVSSTRIRTLIGMGEMQEANRLLGTPYFISGTVKQGNQLGRKMQTPTANLSPDIHKVLPPYGVYAVLAEGDEKIYEGVCNLGVKPTIPGENPVGLEVWLFDYEGNLYGKELTVWLLDYLRPERKFDSLMALQTQIQKDTARAREILARPDIESLRQSVLR